MPGRPDPADVPERRPLDDQPEREDFVQDPSSRDLRDGRVDAETIHGLCDVTSLYREPGPELHDQHVLLVRRGEATAGPAVCVR